MSAAVESVAGPTRIRLSRAKGWRLPAGAVKVDRTTTFGNPFDFRAAAHAWTALAFGCRGDPRGRQAASVKAFADWVDPGEGRRVLSTHFQIGLEDGGGGIHGLAPLVSVGPAPKRADIVAALSGRDLACWCGLCPDHAEGKPFHIDCGACGPCHADVLGRLANGLVCERVAP